MPFCRFMPAVGRMPNPKKNPSSHPFSRKQVMPGHQSKRGVGEKKPAAGPTRCYAISLTKPGHQRLRELAHSRSQSISGFIEDVAWGEYVVISQDVWCAYISGLSSEALLHLHHVLGDDLMPQTSNAALEDF